MFCLRNSSSTLSCVCSERGLDTSWDNTVDDFFNIDGGTDPGGGWDVDEYSWLLVHTGVVSIGGRTGLLFVSCVVEFGLENADIGTIYV